MSQQAESPRPFSSFGMPSPHPLRPLSGDTAPSNLPVLPHSTPVPQDNSLKVAPPGAKAWSVDSLKTSTRQICIQTDGTAMSELCLGGWCWTSAFDVNQKWCVQGPGSGYWGRG